MENWTSCISVAIKLLANDRDFELLSIPMASFDCYEHEKGEDIVCIPYVSTTFSSSAARFLSGRGFGNTIMSTVKTLYLTVLQ